MIIGVLALQGAVREHLQAVNSESIKAVEVKKADDFQIIDGLVLPGGESTTIRRLIQVCNLESSLKKYIESGKPIFGTCAGMILLASAVVDEPQPPTACMNIKVQRNSFGRQVDSFETNLDIKHIGRSFPAIFIRAPHITQIGPEIEVLATYNDKVVMAKQNNYLACSFHPELTADKRVINYFTEMVRDFKIQHQSKAN